MDAVVSHILKTLSFRELLAIIPKLKKFHMKPFT